MLKMLDMLLENQKILLVLLSYIKLHYLPYLLSPWPLTAISCRLHHVPHKGVIGKSVRCNFNGHGYFSYVRL